MSKSNGRYKTKWAERGFSVASRTAAANTNEFIQQLAPLVSAIERECANIKIKQDDHPLGILNEVFGPPHARVALRNIEALAQVMKVILDGIKENTDYETVSEENQ